MATQAPLHYESSAGTTHLQVIESLPTQVVSCLQNARFLHLATCQGPYPHVSLMNYTYLPSSPYSLNPLIVMTTNPSSKKTENLVANPHVSLLVHDWVSHRPPTTSSNRRTGSPPPEASRSSLASLLLNLNTSAMSNISATINGDARLVERGTEEEDYYKNKHLENNTFDDEGDGARRVVSDEHGEIRRGEDNDGGRGIYIEGEEVRVVVVEIKEGRTADWKGGVSDWCLKGDAGSQNQFHDSKEMVNGGR